MKYLIHVIIELVLILIFFIKLFIKNDLSLLFVLITLILFLITSIILYKNRHTKSRKEIDCIFIIVGCSILLIAAMYLIGLKTGFTNNYSNIFRNYLEKSTFVKVISIVLLSELLRRQICSIEINNKYKRFILKGLLIVLLVFIDCSISDMSREFKNFSQFYSYFALIIFASISKNIFLNSIIEKYSINSTLIYRLIMDLYIFFLPVAPNFNTFIEASIYLVYPLLLYAIINNILEDKELEDARKKKHSIIYDIPMYILGLIIVILVSREFTYCMIAIGSGSMTGEFSKGDAIIYKKYDKKDSTIDDKKLKKGDIIVFSIKDRIIVHRINDIYTLYGEDIYITKGDANESIDDWVVTQDDIVGVVKKKIKFIAWPSVWLTENFK